MTAGNIIRRHVSVSLVLLMLSGILGLMTYQLAHAYGSASWHILDSLAQNLVLFYRQSNITTYMKAISWIGRWGIMAGWVAIAISLLIKRRYAVLIICLSIALTGTLSGLAVKQLVHRPRPEGIALVNESNYSFPSLHSLSSTIFAFTCVYLIFLATRSNLLSLLGELTAFIFIIIVDISRIYLGVHYLSDVLAGFLMGFCVLSGILGIAKLIWILTYLRIQTKKI